MAATWQVTCPKCSKPVITQPISVVSYYDPRYICKHCNTKTPLKAKRPE